ncbi:O-methyltransferase [Verticillium alfalfae VaMs.102]|uniref:O-methyltransferase n=1 Tax=Verticillium alfalfae (strain VaMs.102 / ATCC MYA-4576 / FGSC 10136) TaxID=526221 RepID=C9SU21_VERA1|nr:O-methyltransferase [Verticillium alfalfae VaMs.102]EEY22332.1 O-methyltransferase [Verticillium alfalfae VaMs.102]
MVASNNDTAQFRDDLRRLTPELLSSVLDYTSISNVDDDVAARNKIVAAAQAIIEAARPPQPQWMNQSAACAEFVALRLFIDWGAFEAIPIEGSITYQELADKVDAEVQLVLPLMGPHLGLYDFDWVAEAAKNVPSDRPLLVDVGGGKGHVMKTFCDGNTPLTLDRCVLQDLPPIIEHNKADVNSGLGGATLMAIDFHKEQPVQGTCALGVRLCAVIGIMKHTAAAMADDSKLLIAEYIMSNPPSKFAIWMDFIMCMSGGKERTKAMWHEVTNQAGLKIVAFHGLDTSPDGHAVIEKSWTSRQTKLAKPERYAALQNGGLDSVGANHGGIHWLHAQDELGRAGLYASWGNKFMHAMR